MLRHEKEIIIILVKWTCVALMNQTSLCKSAHRQVGITDILELVYILR